MPDVIESLQEEIDGDYQQRELYSLSVLAETEPCDSPILIMLKYWMDSQGSDPKPPSFDVLPRTKLWKLKIPHHVTLIDCSAMDPRNFQVLYHAYDVANEPWLFGEPVSGTHVGNLPSRLHSQSLQSDYLLAKNCETNEFVPYSRITQVVNGIFRDYLRLLLPFTGPQGDVTMLAAATRMTQPKSSNPAFFPRQG